MSSRRASVSPASGPSTNNAVASALESAQVRATTLAERCGPETGRPVRGSMTCPTRRPATMRTLRWLPEHLFESEHANRTILLYYTGITRLAKSILYEIVRGIFLNSPEHLRVIGEIAGNAELAFSAIQRCERGALEEAVANSWELNQRLDAGTNPPAVQAILGRIGDYVAACKLLGAGVGGYLLLLAKDETAAERLRRELTDNSPNPRARFVQFGVSRTGLQLTRS